MSRLVLADLHGEWLLSGRPPTVDQGGRRSGDVPLCWEPPARPLPRRALERLSAAGTLMRVLCEDGDRLWTPLPVDPACLPAVPGLGRPRLEHGEAPDLAGDELLAWMVAPVGELFDPAALQGARQAADRCRTTRFAEQHGLALPGGARLHAPAEVRGALAALGDRPWVLKPAFTAAGRGHIRGRGPDVPIEVERHFAAGGTCLVLEPWLDRLEDLGACGEREADGTLRWVGAHRLLVTPGGRFRGIEVGRPWPAETTAVLHRTLEMVSDLARPLPGAVGIDACLHRPIDGRASAAPLLHPLVEFNPRWTFGRLAHQLVAALGASSGRLELARGDAPRPDPQPDGRRFELLLPDPAHAGGGTRAWLDVPA